MDLFSNPVKIGLVRSPKRDGVQVRRSAA